MLQLVLWMRDCFNIAGEVPSEHGFFETIVHGVVVGKKVGFDHVSKKVNCSTLPFIWSEQGVERRPVASKDLGDDRTPVMLDIINEYDKATRLLAEKAASRNRNVLFVFRRNDLAASDHPQSP